MFLRDASCGCVCNLTFMVSAGHLFEALRSFAEHTLTKPLLAMPSINIPMLTRLTQIKWVSDTSCETACASAEPQWVVYRAMLVVFRLCFCFRHARRGLEHCSIGVVRPRDRDPSGAEGKKGVKAGGWRVFVRLAKDCVRLASHMQVITQCRSHGALPFSRGFGYAKRAPASKPRESPCGGACEGVLAGHQIPPNK